MSKVFVLGAGASREYGSKRGSVPINKDFWSTADRIISEAIKKQDPGPRTDDGGHLDYVKIADNLKAWYKIGQLQDLYHHGLEKIFSDVEEQHPSSLKDFKRLLEWVLFDTIGSIDGNSAPTHYAFVNPSSWSGKYLCA